MADDEDHEFKTEEASDKKITDTLEKGNFPVSRDATTIVGFFAFLLCMSYLIDARGEALFGSMRLLLGGVGDIRMRNGADARNIVAFVLKEMGTFLTPIVALFAVGGLAASFAQGASAVIFDRIIPDFSRISPAKGWSRVFGVTGLIELLKSVVKILIVAGAASFSIHSDAGALRNMLLSDLALTPVIASRLIIHLASVISIAAFLLAAADIAWSRMKWRRDLRMSRQDMKDEHKQSEGDPFVKSRMRSVALTRARRRMMAAVPKATMIIANPTHYAIALRYMRDESAAPVVVAKGQDLLALKIREIAAEHDIPVVERKELARAMYDHVQVDKMIPPEFFRPIAEVIHFLHTKQGARPNAAPRA